MAAKVKKSKRTGPNGMRDDSQEERSTHQMFQSLNSNGFSWVQDKIPQAWTEKHETLQEIYPIFQAEME